MDPVQVLSAAALIALALRAFREGRSQKEESQEPSSPPSPEYLNFKVDQNAIDRLRDPTMPPIAKPIETPEEREGWLERQVSSRALAFQSSPWDTLKSEDGLFHEYNCSRTVTFWDNQRLREFAKIGYEVNQLSSKNLPSFQGLHFNEHLDRIDRVWKDFPSCELTIQNMTAGQGQIRSLVQTLSDLHRSGLRVETIPVWLLLQKKQDGEFFIPHIPQLREETFPSNFQVKMKGCLKAPAHLFGPKDEPGPNLCSFQFQLGSLVWRLLAGEWPYDIEPLLLLRRENPIRVSYGFSDSLTPVLLRMTSLEPQERYENLGSALEELAAGLA